MLLAGCSKVACFLALAGDLHHTPLAENRFQKAGFVIAFLRFIIALCGHLSRWRFPAARIFSRRGKAAHCLFREDARLCLSRKMLNPR